MFWLVWQEPHSAIPWLHLCFILLVGVIIYHMYLLVRKDHPRGEEVNEYSLAPVQPAATAEVVTHTVIEIPKPRDQSTPDPLEK